VNELVEQILSQLRAIWRFRWFAVVVAWVIALAGWANVYMMPDRYEADARVYVDTQSVLRPLLVGLAVQPNRDQIVTIMSQTLISRPNVEKVIQMAGLDVGLNTDDERAKLRARLSKEITIKSAGKENVYTISWADKDPQVVQRVVQSILTLFVEASVTDNRKDSDLARKFIDDQLQGYREKLVVAENAVTAFKRQHPGLMPGEGSGYYARLYEAKAALNRSVLELKEAENSRDSIKKQLEHESAMPSSPQDENIREPNLPETELDARIRSLEQKLDGLRLSYTEQHPDIVAILPVLAQLRERRQSEVKLKASLPSAVASQTRSPLYQQLMVSLTAAEANVAAMKTRVDEYRQRYAELQAAANAMPQVEAEYIQLTRDYEVIKTRYDELLKRRESAQISGDMESSGAATGFRVIDPPQLPSMPKSPNRPLLMSLVLLAALGGGLGAAFLLGQARPTISDERRLREMSGLPVLGTVVMVWNNAQKTRQVRGIVAFCISLLGLLSAYGAIMSALVLNASRV
jgi:polysaccharide chain length determinant protein (PEP-CTERM system associated)